MIATWAFGYPQSYTPACRPVNAGAYSRLTCTTYKSSAGALTKAQRLALPLRPHNDFNAGVRANEWDLLAMRAMPCPVTGMITPAFLLLARMAVLFINNNRAGCKRRKAARPMPTTLADFRFFSARRFEAGTSAAERAH